jgi:hypothetical protein
MLLKSDSRVSETLGGHYKAVFAENGITRPVRGEKSSRIEMSHF